ncbi:MAG: hypothetical protein LCH95_13165 [Proteobacteria bacterium]|nr:hypothetical protein [Pseudomonadota bacterium]
MSTRLLFLMAVLALPLAAQAQGISTTRCYKIGVETRCETQTDNHYAPTGEKYQLPKVTTCWKVGDQMRCETR